MVGVLTRGNRGEDTRVSGHVRQRAQEGRAAEQGCAKRRRLEVGAEDMRPAERAGAGGRKRGPVTYDETKRRATRRRGEHGYMEQGGRGGMRKRVLLSGTLVLERVVRGRYTWHDSLLTGRKRRA